MGDGLRRAAAAAKATRQEVRLSDRQEAALLALSGRDTAADGATLAGRMSEIWRETSPAAAHQAANGLVVKNLAIKGYLGPDDRMRYLLTPAGRAEARRRRRG